jgi:hypothetical protein
MISCRHHKLSAHPALNATEHMKTHRNFRVPHRALQRLLLSLIRALRTDRALYLKRELLDLPHTLRPGRLVLLPRHLECIKRLCILAQRKQYARFTNVRLDYCDMKSAFVSSTDEPRHCCHLPKEGSTRIASSASLSASGNATSFVYARARLLYPRASLGSRLMLSV